MKNRTKLIIFIPIILILLTWLTIFIIDYNRYLNGKTPLFTLNITINDGIDSSYTEYNCLLYKVIKYESLYGRNDMEFKIIFATPKNEYLTEEEYEFLNKYISVEENNSDEQICFTTFKIYKIDKEKKYLKNVSLLKNVSCYYEKDRNIIEKSNETIPMKLSINTKNEILIENIKVSKNNKDMNKIFEKSVVISMNNNSIDNDLKNKVEEYFYPLKLNK